MWPAYGDLRAERARELLIPVVRLALLLGGRPRGSSACARTPASPGGAGYVLAYSPGNISPPLGMAEKGLPGL